MQRPCILRLGVPMPHILAGMIGAGELAQSVIAGACQWVRSGSGNGQRGLWGRNLIVIGVAATRPGRQVIFAHAPGCQALGEMLGIGCGIGRQGDGGFGGFGHGAVVAMLAGHVEKGRDDDVGAFLAIGADQALDDPVPAPAGEGIGTVFGEAEIMHGIIGTVAEPDHIGIQFAGGFLHFAGAQHAQGAGAFRAERVLAAFAAGGAGNDDAHAHAEPHQGQHAALLVVGMGAGIHHRQRRGQPGEGAVERDNGGAGLAAGETVAGGQHGRPVGRFRQ
ncbi:hypothetical protein FF80_02207 [Devosia sp. LC5]|nr:hypothetical protein FF80_02207 [Devosia sp. LC5]